MGGVPYGQSLATGGTNADGTPNTIKVASPGPYGPLVQIPQHEVDFMNRFNRNRQQAAPVAAPPQPVVNTVLGGRETAAPTTDPGASPVAPVQTSATGAFANILRLLLQGMG
jgi:hypothetical protein